jgi:hypothetical protein
VIADPELAHAIEALLAGWNAEGEVVAVVPLAFSRARITRGRGTDGYERSW